MNNTNLVDTAKKSGVLAHRSTAQQVECWINLGSKVEAILTPVEILLVISGAAKIDVLSKIS